MDENLETISNFENQGPSIFKYNLQTHACALNGTHCPLVVTLMVYVPKSGPHQRQIALKLSFRG